MQFRRRFTLYILRSAIISCRRLGIAVPRQLGHGSYFDTLVEQIADERAPEVMRAETGDPCLFIAFPNAFSQNMW